MLRVEVGLRGRFVEHVVLDADEHPRRVDRAAQAALSDRDPWVTVPTRDADRTADRLREHGFRTPARPEWMMSVALDDQRRARRPQGYVWEVDESDGVLHLVVTASDEEIAATGQLAVVGDCAVPDKIETYPAHQRRGLGSVVMGMLVETALDLGATHGLLMASTGGRALYTSLRWNTLCPVVIGRLWD